LLDHAQKVAPATSTLLIRGESGAGKDLLATIIHALSPRADEPLVKIDCASLPFSALGQQPHGRR
jgi:Nif-specific regulatory protein